MISIVCLAATLATGLLCLESVCPSVWVFVIQRGDGFCDLPCNTAACGFDGAIDLESSDCYSICPMYSSSSGCGMFWDTVCEFGWGYCGYCALYCKNKAGFESDLGDGECKPECDVTECQYDGGDCVKARQGFCNSGCFQHMLGDGECQSECMTAECSHDEGDCDDSLCSPGCYPELLGNGQCNEACNVDSCHWDEMECQCAHGCSQDLLNNSLCDDVCNVLECGFDNHRCVIATQGDCSSGCFEEFIGDGHCNAACNVKECDWDRLDCGCAPGCSFEDVGSCKSECLVPECNYDTVSFEALTCEVSSCVSVDEFTTQCWAQAACRDTEFRVVMNCCEECCKAGYSPHAQNPTVCVRAKDESSEVLPQLLYVSATAESADSDGSLEQPFATLRAAILRLYENYTHIILLPGSYALERSGAVIIGQRNNYSSLLYPQVYPHLRRLRITSYECLATETCTRVMLVVSDRDGVFFFIPGISLLELVHLDFSSTVPLGTPCQNDVLCITELDFLLVLSPSRLKLEHVAFRHFEIASIVSLDDTSLELYDVDFHDIVATKALVSSFTYANVTYQGGSVTQLSRGLSNALMRDGSGFLRANKVDLQITEVRFASNFLYGTITLISPGSLILFEVCSDCKVRNCTFEDNVGSSLFLSTGNMMDFLIGSLASVQRLAAGGILIANCLFINNTGSSSLSFRFLTQLQSLIVIDCTFVSEHTESMGIVAIRGSQKKLFRSTDSFKIVQDNGYSVRVNFPAVEILLQNLTFIGCTSAEPSLLTVFQVPRVRVSGLLIYSQDSCSASWTSTAAAPTSLLNFTSISVLTLHQLQLSDTCECLHASGDFLDLSSSVFERSMTATSLLALNFSVEASLFNNSFVDNTVDGEYGMLLLRGNKVVAAACVFEGNYAYQGSVHLESVASVELFNCEFRENRGQRGSAVFAMLQMGNSYRLELSGCSFLGNSGAISGTISLQLNSGLATFTLQMSDCLFIGNDACFGSALHSSAGLAFSLDSAILGCRFVNNSASESGVLHFSPSSGLIRLERSSFSENSGKKGTALFRQCLSTPCEVHISEVNFEANFGEALVLLADSLVNSLCVLTSLNFTQNTGTCIKAELTFMTGIDLAFLNNQAIVGAALAIQSSNVSLHSAMFEENSVTETGGAVSIERGTSFECFYCVFLSNAARQGGALYVKQSFSVFVTDSIFQANSAEDGFAIFMSVCSSISLIAEASFTQNRGTGLGVISLLSVSMELRGVKVLGNQSAQTAGVVAQLATLLVSECKFGAQQGTSGVLLYLYHSSARMSSSLLRDSRAYAAGGAVLASASELEVLNCSFQSLGAMLGGAVFLQSEANVTILESVFSNIITSLSSAIDASKSTIGVLASRFEAIQGSALAGSDTSLQVANCTFQDIERTAAGGGISCIQCSEVSITHSHFSRLKADLGSAIYLRTAAAESIWEISHSVFEENFAEVSGTVLLEEVRAVFHSNRMMGNSAQDHGGGLVLLNGNFTVEDNLFERNSVIGEGGAVWWQGTFQPIFKNNFFEGNSAAYGSQIASYAVKIELEANSSALLVDLASGQVSSSSVSLLLLDHYGAVVSNDISSDAEMVSADHSASLAGVTRAQSLGGRFVFDQFVVVAPPGSNVSLSIVTSATNNSVQLTASMRNCLHGESLINNQCVICQPGTYSLVPNSGCNACPSAAVCYGNFTMVPRPGYWRADNLSDAFFECLNADSCLGSPTGSFTLTGACAEGYEGNKCQSCTAEHFRWGRIHCSECPSASVRSGVRIAVASVACIFMAAVMKTSTSRGNYSISLKIYLNYVQFVMQLGSLSFRWPFLERIMFQGQEAVGAFFEVLLICLEDEDEPGFYRRLLALTLLPIALFALCFLVWTLVAWRRRSLAVLTEQMISSMIFLFLFSYPSVTRTSMQLLMCEEISPGEFWVVGQQIRCWTHEHLKNVLSLVLPSLIVWGVGLPAILVLILWRQRKSLFSMSGQKRFGSLVLPYHRDRYYWEFVVLGRKAAMVALTAVGNSYQAVSALGVLAVVILLQHNCAPYVSKSYNMLEFKALLLVAVTLYAGFLFSSSFLNEYAEMVLFAIVAATNGYFVLAALKLSISHLCPCFKHRQQVVPAI